MPIIYTYPSVTPTADDLILISDVSATNPTKATRKCTIGDIVTLVGALVPGGGTVTSVGLSGGTTGLTIATTTTNPITTTGTFTVGGTLVAANGGTGHNSYTTGDILYASGATALTKLPAGTVNHVLTSGGPGVAPSWTAGTSTLMATWTLAGGSGPSQTISNTDTVTIAATAPITSVASATDTVTIAMPAFTGGANVGYVPSASGAGAGEYLDYQGNWNIPTNTTYSLMTSSALGLGKLENNTTQIVVANAPSATVGRTYGIQKNSSDQLVVNVPWSGSPGRVNYDNQLAFKGGTSGTYVPNISRTAQYWVSGDKVYMEFYMEWSTAHGCVGTMIMTNLPLAGISPTGATNEQGSVVVTVNNGLGTGATTGAPTTGRPGVTGANEIIFRSHNGTTGILFDSLWANLDGDVVGNYILAGTASWFTGALA